ncbi:MAG: UbiX family flavin prenyltransferase [Magnetococcales bacterium]|nr:UbiX family flavin prenyltransferase [Magnetococcales bacterium]
MTGASGAAYGLGLIQALLVVGERVEVLVSSAALQVVAHECRLSWPDDPQRLQQALSDHFDADAERLRCYGLNDWHAPVASGSGGRRRMVVCPCSMGTLAALAHGLADNLIRRAADVILKEGGTLLLVPRETPLTTIHLENMLRLARAGAIILPASPGFYHRPETVAAIVDFVVARVMSRLGLVSPAAPQWPPPVAI